MTSYIALLRKDADSDFGVEFPDFPGCVTAGTSLEEARTMAAEALEMHVEGMIGDGAALPDPSTLDAIASDRSLLENAVPFLVDLPLRKARKVRINVMLQEDLIAAIDRVATNRSQFLEAAARERLAQTGETRPALVET